MIPEDEYRLDLEEIGPGYKCGLCGSVIAGQDAWLNYSDEAAKTTKTLHFVCWTAVVDIAMGDDELRQRALARVAKEDAY